jgi:hypothetical protein
VHSIEEARARLSRLDRLAGRGSGDLTIGDEVIRLMGLTDSIASMLHARWGGFFSPAGGGAPQVLVRTVSDDGDDWLPRWRAGEGYRVEADAAGGPLVVRSYHFALGPEIGGAWRLAVHESAAEPVARVVENAVRYLVARRAIERGGIAVHGAGVKRSGKAWIFAGASGSGKSTAVRLLQPVTSLGDDFAVIVPAGGGWASPALPFDNAETAPSDPERGLVPLGGIFRLFKADRHRVERPTGVLAQASLLACAAFPWALPDLADRAGESIARLASSGLYGHLHFAVDPGFWSVVESG